MIPYQHRSRASRLGATIAFVFALCIAVVPVSINGCGPARNALMTITPGVPSPTPGVDAGTNRCNANVPEVCSNTGRCWPSLPRDAFGHQRACLAGCALDDAGVAVCLPADAGVNSDGGVE
jgi:hypothetical protein